MKVLAPLALSALLVCGAWVPAVLCALMVPLGRWAQRVVAAN